MVLYSMISLKSPYYEIDNPFQIYDVVKAEKFPTISKEHQLKYSSGLIKLHRNCIRVNPQCRPTISEILIVIQQLTWSIENVEQQPQ